MRFGLANYEPARLVVVWSSTEQTSTRSSTIGSVGMNEHIRAAMTTMSMSRSWPSALGFVQAESQIYCFRGGRGSEPRPLLPQSLPCHQRRLSASHLCLHLLQRLACCPKLGLQRANFLLLFLDRV